MVSLQKIDREHKIKLPPEFLSRLKIRPGETLHTEMVGDRLILHPMSRRKNYPPSSAIIKVQKKMERINLNPLRSKGLTAAEIGVAIKAGLIDKQQAWFWTIGWQKMEREADRSRTFEFDNVKDALQFLHK